LIAFALPHVSIEILDGDIAAQSVAAIVNAANNAFWMGSGVAGAIKARGGLVIEEEAVEQGPVEPGQCVITSGGRLPARHVIHAAVMGQDLQTSAALIETATRSALALAHARQLESIAFPALGTGVGGFPLDECARIMIATVAAHAAAPTSIRTVRFVLYGRQAYDAFAAAASIILKGRNRRP
jgi:O-acetyl-ADP-ribose deacetylase